MISMENIQLIPRIKSGITFDDVLETAKAKVDSFTEVKQKKLKQALDNGLANYSSKDELDMYIASYGDIHRKKLQIAFHKIPTKVWNEGSISVIDYGCGQCIAEMALSDFLGKLYIGEKQIADFTLVEPNELALKQGIKYLRHFFKESEIKAYNLKAGSLRNDYLRPKSEVVIHIFSNVLDVIDFERRNIANILNQDMYHSHILVCVSPFYQENGRGALMDEFGKMLRGMRCEFKFQKHTDEWDNPYSCQIRIFVSAYF